MSIELDQSHLQENLLGRSNPDHVNDAPTFWSQGVRDRNRPIDSRRIRRSPAEDDFIASTTYVDRMGADARLELRGNITRVQSNLDVDQANKKLVTIKNGNVRCAELLAEHINLVSVERHHVHNIRRAHQHIIERFIDANRGRFVQRYP